MIERGPSEFRNVTLYKSGLVQVRCPLHFLKPNLAIKQGKLEIQLPPSADKKNIFLTDCKNKFIKTLGYTCQANSNHVTFQLNQSKDEKVDHKGWLVSYQDVTPLQWQIKYSAILSQDVKRADLRVELDIINDSQTNDVETSIWHFVSLEGIPEEKQNPEKFNVKPLGNLKFSLASPISVAKNSRVSQVIKQIEDIPIQVHQEFLVNTSVASQCGLATVIYEFPLPPDPDKKFGQVLPSGELTLFTSELDQIGHFSLPYFVTSSGRETNIVRLATQLNPEVQILTECLQIREGDNGKIQHTGDIRVYNSCSSKTLLMLKICLQGNVIHAEKIGSVKDEHVKGIEFVTTTDGDSELFVLVEVEEDYSLEFNITTQDK